jgi:protein-tyrosine phosphatase
MIDTHNHFLPDLDDGCRTVRESLECLQQMVAAGYGRIFCTPHCGANEFNNLPCSEVAERVRSLQGHATAAGISIEIRPGGELRLTESLAALLPELGGGGVPTYGHSGKYVLADLWEEDWPDWATRAVEWLQNRGHIVIIAHPERMPSLLQSPGRIDELGRLGVLFQGNLGPIGGADSVQIVTLAERYLQDGRYFMAATDGHRTSHLARRLAGLARIHELVGAEELKKLTESNPARLWQ